MKHLIIVLSFILLSIHTHAATLKAKNTSELLSALSKAKGGDVIKLAKGNYTAFNLNGTTKANKYISSYTSEVVIESEVASAQAVFSTMKMISPKNMTFRNVTFKVSSAPANGRLVDIARSTNLKFVGVKFIGRTVDGYGADTGLYTTGSPVNLRIENCSFTTFRNGANIYGVNGLTIINSNFSNISYDVLQMAYVYNVLIENNLMAKASHPSNDDHQDLIQIAHNIDDGGLASSSNIVIRANRLEASDAKTHGIYIENKKAKATLNKAHFYRNIVIENNDIYTSQALGIAIGNTLGVTVKGNELLQHPNGYSKSTVRIPVVRVGNTSETVNVTNNIVHLAPTAAQSNDNWVPSATPSGKGWVLTPNTIRPLK